MSDRLTEISIENLRRLRDLYTPDGIKNYAAFAAIDNYLRWNDQDHKEHIENINFFCLNGNVSGGTFVVVVSVIRIHFKHDFYHLIFLFV